MTKDPRGGVHPLRYSEQDLEKLKKLYKEHWQIKMIAREMGRSPESIHHQLDKLRKADPTFKRKFRAGEPSAESLRRKYGAGMGEMHREMKKLSVEARIWLHEQAAEQGYKSIAEMAVDHMIEQFYETGGKA